MLFVIVLFFAICWLPLHTFAFAIDFNPELVNFKTEYDKQLVIAIYYTVHWIAMSNCFVNPIIYSFLNDNFKVERPTIAVVYLFLSFYGMAIKKRGYEILSRPRFVVPRHFPHKNGL